MSNQGGEDNEHLRDARVGTVVQDVVVVEVGVRLSLDSLLQDGLSFLQLTFVFFDLFEEQVRVQPSGFGGAGRRGREVSSCRLPDCPEKDSQREVSERTFQRLKLPFPTLSLWWSLGEGGFALRSSAIVTLLTIAEND